MNYEGAPVSLQGIEGVDLSEIEVHREYRHVDILLTVESLNLIVIVEDIETAKDQLAYVPPIEDDAKLSSSAELWKRPIHLMTALRAKGKESDTVILLDVNDDIWPNRNAKTPVQREAERRIFYVAFTRAKNRILMFVSNNYRNRKAVPSPFIGELDLAVD